MRTNLIIKQKTSSFRQQNGISNDEPIRLISLLQKLNVITLFRPLKENISGISLKIKDYRFMVVNSDNTLGKQHFTICHELYHLFIQEVFEYMICNTGLFDKKNKIEYIADLFAANLLLPEEGIIKLIPENELKKNNITLSTIIKTEQYYSSSRKSLLIRLDNLGLINYDKYEKYNNNIILSALRTGYDTALYKKANANKVIGDYGQRARKLYETEKISETHYISLLRDIGIDLEKTP